VWYVNTLVCACKVNLVLNKETCFEAIDGSGGRDPFIFNIIIRLGGIWGNDDTRREVLRGKIVSVCVSIIRIRIKLPIRAKFTYVRIRKKLPIRTKFTKKGKITRNLSSWR